MENNIRGDSSSVKGDRCVKSDENKMILYTAANNWYGWAMSESILYEKKIDRNVKLKNTLNTPDDSDIGYPLEVDFRNPVEIKEKSKFFPVLS